MCVQWLSGSHRVHPGESGAAIEDLPPLLTSQQSLTLSSGHILATTRPHWKLDDHIVPTSNPVVLLQRTMLTMLQETLLQHFSSWISRAVKCEDQKEARGSRCKCGIYVKGSHNATALSLSLFWFMRV